MQVCVCVNIPIIHTRKLNRGRLLLPKPTRVGLETFLNLNPFNNNNNNKTLPFPSFPLLSCAGWVVFLWVEGECRGGGTKGPRKQRTI